MHRMHIQSGASTKDGTPTVCGRLVAATETIPHQAAPSYSVTPGCSLCPECDGRAASDRTMIQLLTCDGYGVVRRIAADADAPHECAAEEIARNDGYAVIAMAGGRIVADAEGWIKEDHGPADPMLAAMERRFD